MPTPNTGTDHPPGLSTQVGKYRHPAPTGNQANTTSSICDARPEQWHVAQIAAVFLPNPSPEGRGRGGVDNFGRTTFTGDPYDSHGVERYTDLPVGPIDWPFVNAEIGLP